MENQTRELKINTRKADAKSRTAPVVLSTEYPVERGNFTEVLDHSPGAVDLSRSPLPVIEGHDASKLNIGVVDDLKIVGKKLRGVLRLGNSQRAKEIWDDILAGVVRSVSIGYQVINWIEEGNDVVRVTKFMPYELSLVAAPADPDAGLFRSMTMENENEQPTRSQRRQENNSVVVERERVRDLLATGEQYNANDLAREFVGNGGSLSDLNKAILSRMGKAKPIEAVAPQDMEIGLTQSEARKYSIIRAVNAQIDKDWSNAGFERECSMAVAQKHKRAAQGFFVPVEVMKRDLNIGTATAGGNLVPTDYLGGSFIDMLRAKSQVMRLGATMLDGLSGNVAIPRKTSGSTAYWVAEGVAPTESQPAFDQVTLTPNTVGGFTDYTRKMLLQASPDIEMLVRGDLASTIALEVDRVAIEGSGSGSEPTGILNTTGVGVVAIGTNGGALTWDHIVDLEGEVAVDNADEGALAYLTNSTVRKSLKKTTKVSADAGAGFIWEPGNEAGFGRLNGYQAAVSNNVPADLTQGTGTNLSAVIFGNFADLLIGQWSVLDIMVDPYTFSSTGTVRIVALQDVDLAVRHAQSFAAITDAIA